jgi:hypothetical protein
MIVLIVTFLIFVSICGAILLLLHFVPIHRQGKVVKQNIETYVNNNGIKSFSTNDIGRYGFDSYPDEDGTLQVAFNRANIVTQNEYNRKPMLNISQDALTVHPQVGFSNDVSFYGQKVMFNNQSSLDIASKTVTFSGQKVAFNSRPEFKDGIELDRLALRANGFVFTDSNNSTLFHFKNNGDIGLSNGACMGLDAGAGVCFNAQGDWNSRIKGNTLVDGNISTNNANIRGTMNVDKDARFANVNLRGNMGVDGIASINGVNISRKELPSPDDPAKILNYMKLNMDGLVLADGTVIGNGSSKEIKIGDWIVAAENDILVFKHKNKRVLEVDGGSTERQLRLYDGADDGKKHVAINSSTNSLLLLKDDA